MALWQSSKLSVIFGERKLVKDIELRNRGKRTVNSGWEIVGIADFPLA